MSEVVVLADRRKPPQAPSEMMLQITIYDDGEGTLWLSDFFTQKEQFNWAAAKIAEVTTALIREKAARSGEM